jgi:hypothetical protein
MSRTIAIGAQDFEKIRRNGSFLVDKTLFIKEWWENQDDVTLITRPRRFGKTLTMSMVDCFFNVERRERKLADGSNIFEGLKICEEEKYRQLQGTYPVIALSFAKIKDNTYEKMYDSICLLLYNTLRRYNYIFDDDRLPKDCSIVFEKTKNDLLNHEATSIVNDSLNML